MPRFDLRDQAAQFAGELSDLLNGTICHGVRVIAIVGPSGYANVGYKITRTVRETAEGIPLTLGDRPPACWLGLAFRLEPDDEGQYLTVNSSFMGIFTDAGLTEALVHYDYERGKQDGYPEAHVQVCAGSDAWTGLCEQAGLGPRPLQRLHLPVGGRRFRPTVEDLIHFLVTERLVDARPTWAEQVEAGQERFRRRQLRATVRRDPESALDVLRREGHIS